MHVNFKYNCSICSFINFFTMKTLCLHQFICEVSYENLVFMKIIDKYLIIIII